MALFLLKTYILLYNNSMKISVIVLNWNGYADTIKCVDSILKGSPEIKIVLVDNGSTDDSIEKLKAYKNKVKYIFNKSNLGFAEGVNCGIKWSIENGFEFVVLVNNDVILDYNWLDEVASSMLIDDKIGVVTGLLLDYKGVTIDSVSEEYSKWGLAFPRKRGLKTENAPSSGFVFGATGGASMYRVAMIKEIGLFDKDFFAYYEDVDLSFRAQLYGWKVYYNSKAIAYHKRGATSSKIPGFTVYQTFKNLPLLLIKNVPTKLLFSVGLRFKLAYSLMFLNAIKKGQGTYALRGFLMAIVLSFKKIPLRLKLQNKKTVNDEYIKSILWQDLPPDQKGLRKFRKIFLSK